MTVKYKGDFEQYKLNLLIVEEDHIESADQQFKEMEDQLNEDFQQLLDSSEKDIKAISKLREYCYERVESLTNSLRQDVQDHLNNKTDLPDY